MKKASYIKLLSAAFMVISLVVLTALRPAEDFEGIISFSIEYIEVPAEVEAFKAMLPQEMAMTYKGEMVQVKQSIMGGSQIVVMNQVDSSGFMLMDMMGQRIHVPMTKQDLLEAEGKTGGKPDIQYLKDTKEILGHPCTKVIINQGGVTSIMWVTKDLGLTHSSYSELDGFPLEYEASQNSMKLRMTAKKINRQSVDDTEFAIPEGFQTMSMEDIQRFGQ